MKTKSFFLTSICLLVFVLLYTGCSSPGNDSSNSVIKTKDDSVIETKDEFIRELNLCKQFAHEHHINFDSSSGYGDPPVVTLNDTLYLYFGQGGGSPLSTKSGTGLTPITQIKGSWGTALWSYMGINSAQPMANYAYRIAIPLTNFTNPTQNPGTNLTSNIGPGQSK